MEDNDEGQIQNTVHKSTPPRPFKKVRNPFDRALIEKLHKPICSPGMCKIYKKKSNGSFRWDIDQACTLVPADIVACSSQFEPSPDPALEKLAEEAADRYFSEGMVIPSPQIETSKKIKPLLISSSDTSVKMDSLIREEIVLTREASSQTMLTLPPVLPPELEKLLQPFCTFTQDQDISDEYEVTANGSLRRKLFFLEEHSDIENSDSEHTDDEINMQSRPPSSYEAHTPVVFSPDLSQDFVAKGMKRTFGTPLKTGSLCGERPCYRNKILDVVDFGEPCFSPIGFQTPKRTDQASGASSSLASASISPVTKAASDDEKNNFTSPECETMAVCLDCVESRTNTEKKNCFCKLTPNKVKRSASLKDSPRMARKNSFSFSEKRSLSMSSLHRSRSVQKLDFSMDMSIDSSLPNRSHGNSESSSPVLKEASWSLVDETSIHHLVKRETEKNRSCVLQSCTTYTQPADINIDETPIKGKCKSNVRSHEISKIRAPFILSPHNMSLDDSLGNIDNPLSLENKKIDFNTVDLNFLSDTISQREYSACNKTKVGGDCSTSFKRVDSAFNENTFYTNSSSYYESAIKPSELTVTNASNSNSNVLKEISNVHWMRVDSGFKDDCSSDATQFYIDNDNSVKKFNSFQFSEVQMHDKENVASGNFDKFLVQTNRNDAMSMSDIFTDEMTFNCNFSSTPSKNKSRKVHS